MASNGEPRIGPFSIQVPPPSPNGHHTAKSSALEPVRRAAPALVAGLVLSVSTVPARALLHTGELAYWWRILIASALAGLVCGVLQRGTKALVAVTGAAVATAGLLLAYTIVRSEVAADVSVVGALADVGRLAAWGIVVGGTFALASETVRAAIARGRRSRRRVG